MPARKLRIKIRLKLWNKGKLVLSTTKLKKSAIYAELKRVIHDSSYIRVLYAPGFWNDGEYDTDEKLLNALSAFTEKSLTDEFNIGGKND